MLALIHAGPLLAGLAAHSLATVPVFAALGLLFIGATRRPDLHRPEGWVTLAGLALVQGALAAGIFALGRFAGDAAGSMVLPEWLPIALSFVAAAYGAWAYSERAEMDVFLDSTIERLQQLAAGDPHAPPTYHPAPAASVMRALATMLEALRALPARAGTGEIDPIVRRYQDAVGIAGFDPLFDAAGTGETGANETGANETGTGETGARDARIDLALLRFAGAPRIRRQLIARGEGGLAPMLLVTAPEPMVRAEARERLRELAEDGAPASQFPDAVWLDELDRRFPGEGFDDLIALSATLSNPAPTR